MSEWMPVIAALVTIACTIFITLAASLSRRKDKDQDRLSTRVDHAEEKLNRLEIELTESKGRITNLETINNDLSDIRKELREIRSLMLTKEEFDRYLADTNSR